MHEEEELELAVYRALRGEVPRSVRLIAIAAAAPNRIRLDIYFEGPASQPWMRAFEEEVENELQQSSGTG